MTRVALALILMLNLSISYGQVKLPDYPDSIFNTYYKQRVATFRSLPHTEHDILFVGNSITEGGSWSELFNDLRIKNRGLNGDISAGVIHRLDEMISRNPDKIFLKIGVNDLSRGISADSLVKNILIMADYLHQEIPATRFFVQSVLPVSEREKKFLGHAKQSGQIIQVNRRLAEEAKAHHYRFVDLHSAFCDDTGRIDSTLTNDGLHLVGKGYQLWKHLVFPHVYDLQDKPALIPSPKQLTWNKGRFPLYDCHTLIADDSALLPLVEGISMAMRLHGLQASLKNTSLAGKAFIRLQLSGSSGSNLPEAYQLQVTTDSIVIRAGSLAGMHNGIQTLVQLMRDGAMIDNCQINDWPAFSWRGFMIDVGRNYVSMPRLKELISVMGKYKLNVFHFHLTEDIAWRMALDSFPALTRPEFMLRNKGMYYSKNEIRELISLCREQHILFIPEIDMPGHSAAFKRAMQTDMQSDSGKIYLLQILKEIAASFDLPYIHIGSDEVHIKDSSFVPMMTRYLQRLGKTVMGWQPGGNYPPGVIRQLWLDDKGVVTNNKQLAYVDSRHLYLNHMDPLESVVTIFNRRIANREKGDDNALGAELCVWPDRAVAKEEDIFRMNPVYPGLLSFAERCWDGGGQEGWVANISDGNEKAFLEFEDRLMDHRQLYFFDKAFPYQRQGELVWKLYGPYDHATEQPGTEKPLKEMRGGTIVLRHWWAPMIRGAIESPRENSIVYATTSIWSDTAGFRDFWIGFNDLSRSPASDSPPLNGWDTKGSQVWVNGKSIAPPAWTHPAQKGDPEIPLSDEGYAYRPPVRILLEKGWNKILIKAPVGSFKPKDWQNPVKWMFSFVEVR